MTDTTTQFKRQLPCNSFFQVLSFVTHVAIGIWLVPYLLGHLGRSAYGLIPIAGMMTQYVALISYSISSAVNRFLTIALQQHATDEANRIFNTAFFSYLAIGLLQIPVFLLVIGYANNTNAYIPDSRIVREGGYEGFNSHRVYFQPGPFTENINREVETIVNRALEAVKPGPA